MAERRMFSRTILESDDFMTLPIVSRMLYVNMNLVADDEGFLGNAKKMLRTNGAKMHHLEVLIDANYLISFDSGIVAIRHWHTHNKLAPGRKVPTQYMKERARLSIDGSGAYHLLPEGEAGDCKTNSEDSASEDSKEKKSKEKNSIGKNSGEERSVREDSTVTDPALSDLKSIISSRRKEAVLSKR